MYFDVEVLIGKWNTLITESPDAVRGIEWNGASYSKQRRSQGPDREALIQHSNALEPLIEGAPNGFPRHRCLRDVLVHLNKIHKWVEDSKEYGWATDGADLWRVMCRHLVELSKTPLTAPAKLRKFFVGMHGHDAEAEDDDIVVRNAAGEIDFGVIVEDPADEQVTMTTAMCNCPDCRIPTIVEDSDADTSEVDARGKSSDEVMPEVMEDMYGADESMADIEDEVLPPAAVADESMPDESMPEVMPPAAVADDLPASQAAVATEEVDPLERAAESFDPVSAAIRQKSIKKTAIAETKAADKALAVALSDALTKPQGSKAGKGRGSKAEKVRIGSLQQASVQKRPKKPEAGKR